jgi:hypothetical protein
MGKKEVKKELEAVTGVTRGDSSEKEYLQRLVRKVAALEDADWDALSKDAQAWYNAAAKAVNKAKQDGGDAQIEGFGDEEEAPPPRRASREAVEDEAPSKDFDPEVGAQVCVTMANGDVFEGELVEKSARSLVVVVAGEEEVLPQKNIKSIAAAKAKQRKDADEEPARDPKVGDTVVVTMNDGDKVKGEVLELGDRSVVIGVGKDEEILRRKDIKSIAVATDKRAARDPEPEAPPATRGKAEKAEKAEKAAGPKPATVRIREIMCEKPAITKEAVAKILDKEGVEIKGTTLDITFSEVTRTLALLRQFGNLKED